ncbi:MAG: succinate dehydrogenase [Candidatus Dormibacteraceae bacterium]
MALSKPVAKQASRDRTVRNPYTILPNWVYPTFVFVALSLFGVFAVWVVFFQRDGYYAPYLSPFFSPLIQVGPIPPAVWVAWAPLAFRVTCYYYRKAYFRSFFWNPRSCSVPEPNRRYRGETAFPWVFNNLHRFAFYVTVVQVGFLWFDALIAFDFGGRFGIGLGTVLIVANVVLLSGYTFGCHAFRHLAGGELDCFSCSLAARARHQLWKGVTVLNIKHDRWAWASLFSVVATDIYIRLLLAGVLRDPRWVA